MDWSDYYSSQRVDSLARRVALRHHDARVGGSVPGLGSFNTVTCVNAEMDAINFVQGQTINNIIFDRIKTDFGIYHRASGLPYIVLCQVIP